MYELSAGCWKDQRTIPGNLNVTEFQDFLQRTVPPFPSRSLNKLTGKTALSREYTYSYEVPTCLGGQFEARSIVFAPKSKSQEGKRYVNPEEYDSGF
ncbi:hypothetical protein CDAR_369671 [Caerostris darwini]|uniref:Uncharacterized protein n=1 Tax=Caerostris darwini TaxID=1538125 RepID=A0AAV4M529_9ARAC|nr:hypothetical protein CDAR_369671 [Caerostris darwini]